MTVKTRNARGRHVVALSFALSLAACAKNPVTGRPQFSLVGEKQEIAMGRQANQEISATLGLYKDEKIQAYVQELGSKMAARSERPNLPWTFRVLDDASVNAFALPGGYVYVTRGMMTHLNSEAELAAVLGHEIGHVTAKHSVTRMSSAQLAQIGLVAGMILKPELQRYGNLAQVGMGLLFLKNSRDHERQADSLGLRYMTASEYDGPAMLEVFSLLQKVGEQAEAQHGRLPNWLATHPAPEARLEKTLAQIEKMPPATAAAKVEREAYLRRIDGMVYGEDPREGFFEGNAFYHPEFAFSATFPPGWQTQNQKQGIVAISPRQDAMIQITLSDQDTPSAAAMRFLQQPGLQTERPASLDVNGLPAVASRFMAVSQNQQLAGMAVFVAHERKVFQIVGFGSAWGWRANERAMARTMASFARLTDPKKLAVQPRRLQLVRVDEPLSLEQFAKRYPSEVPLQSLALVNQLAPGQQMAAGNLAKRVVAPAGAPSTGPAADLRASKPAPAAGAKRRPADARDALN